MLDIRLIRKDPKIIQERLCTKVAETDLSKILSLDEAVRNKKTEVETLKAKRNEASEIIGRKKRAGEDCQILVDEVARYAETIHLLDHEITPLEEELQFELASLPNIPMDDVPISPDPKDNVVVRTWGEKPVFSFQSKNHVELNDLHHLFDFPRAAKLAGSGWTMYKGMGARLEWALLNFMINFHIENGYTQWMPPIAVKKEVLYAAGQLPKFANQQYGVTDGEQELFLIPTAEVPLNGMYMDEVLPEEVLPLKYIAYTPCFRREAGAAGSNERGLIRTHQFNKVEMFAFTTPEDSPKMFEELVGNAEGILKRLELHHRTMLLTTGDMSFGSAKTIDVEVWLPGQNRYYEVSSISNCTDFQSRRSNAKFRRGKDKPQLVHTLNGSGLATSRLMVALLENNQQADGSIIIPKALRPYLGGLEKLEPTAEYV
jgi:seryl-tRNA synthetase